MHNRYYTTWGPQRGGCGHQHRSIEAAFRCVLADRRKSRRRSRVTPADRVIQVMVSIDGSAPTVSSWRMAEWDVLSSLVYAEAQRRKRLAAMDLLSVVNPPLSRGWVE